MDFAHGPLTCKAQLRRVALRWQDLGTKTLVFHIDIFPGLFLWLLFTYSPLLFLWFLFTTVEPWSLACCLEEFPSYAVVYFKANIDHIIIVILAMLNKNTFVSFKL